MKEILVTSKDKKDHSFVLFNQELKQSFANLEVHKIDSKHPCGSRQLLVSALDFLQQHGGVYIGESVILTRFPTDALHKPFWFALSDRMGPNTTQGIIIVKKGFGLAKKAEYSELMSSTKGPCSSVKSYDVLGAHTGAACILALDKMHPRDVWDRKTPFGELARWLYYGKRGVSSHCLRVCTLFACLPVCFSVCLSLCLCLSVSISLSCVRVCARAPV